MGEISRTYSGGTPNAKDKSMYGGAIPFIRSGEIHSDKTELFLSKKGYEASSAKMVDIGDLLLAMYGATAGEIDISKLRGAINQAILCIKTNQNPLFLKYLWESKKDGLLKTYLQGGQGNLSAEIFKSLKMPICDRNEQKYIADFLSIIERRIKVQNKIIEALESLKIVIRNQVFSEIQGNVKTVGEILNYQQPTKYLVETDEYLDDASLTPVLTANKAFVLGYTAEQTGVYCSVPCIIFDDFTMDSKFVNFPFKIKSSAIKILKSSNDELTRYAYEYLKYLGLSSTEHKRHYLSEIKCMSISLAEDKTIATICKLFTAFDEKLEAEKSVLDYYTKEKQFLLENLFI